MIKIGSWNLRNFSKKRDMDPIADVVIQFDLLAIQEVRDDICILLLCEHIKKKHNLDYKYAVSEPVCSTQTTARQTGKRKERYAFIYRSGVELVKSALVLADCHFVRPPLMGFFKCSRFDFILTTIHVVWGKKSDRRAEISSINLLLEAIKEKAGGEGDIILCGDFNTPPEEFALPDIWRPLIHGRTMVNSANIFDNIWITGATGEFTGESGVVGAGKLSDHFPVYATFRDIDDDEGVPNLDIKL